MNGRLRAIAPTRARTALALSGWAALAATALPPANPLRVVVVTGFVLLGPGAAAVGVAGLAPARYARWSQHVAAAALALAVSAAAATVTAEALLLTHRFTPTRAVLVLAVLTTVLALTPPRRRPGPVAAEPAPGGPSPAAGTGPQGPAARTGPHGPAGRAARRIGVYPPVLLLVLAVTACTNATGRTLSAAGSRPPAAADLPPADRLPDLPALPGAWHPVFRDDFDGTALNRADWATCYDWNDGGCTNAGNHELEWYRPGQVHVGDGALTLTADRRATQGGDGHTYPWTSGMVTTGRDSWNGTPRHTFTYGYYAAAIKAPADPAGMFPAFWLIPADSRATPPELDIAEFIHSNQAVDLHLHWRSAAGEDVHDGTRYGPADFAGGYHVFAMDWEPDAVTWYVDGVERYRMDDPSLVPDVPMELVLDLAVGFQAAPPDSVDRTSLQVAWVGVWQH